MPEGVESFGFGGRYVRHRTDMAGCRAHHLTMRARNPKIDLQTLREAGLLLGGEQKLSEFLDIEAWLVARWLEGLGHPPDFIFLRCEELIESGQQAPAGKSADCGPPAVAS